MSRQLFKWHLVRTGDDWYAEREDGKGAMNLHGEHCKACAATTVVLRHLDADFDLRGFTSYSCYGVLAMSVLANRRGDTDE